MGRILGYIANFGRFWWDFFVGEAPLLFIGALATVGLAFALRHDRVAGIILIPLCGLAFLTYSTYRAAKSS